MNVVFRSGLLPEGWADDVRISIVDGVIATVAPRAQAQPGDAHYDIGLPGLPNLHSHAFQRGMAGLSEHGGPAGDDFWTWREVMYRFLARMTPDDVEAIAAQAYAEMLEGGFTRVGEFHYLHHQPDGQPYAEPAEMASRIAAAAAATGIGLTLLPCFYAHGGFGGLPPAPGQRRFISGLDGFARLLVGCRQAIAGLSGARLGIAPHSLRAVTPEELMNLAALVADGPLHIHAAEQTREVADCIAWSGQPPVAWLLAHAGLDARWCLVHATHMTAAESAALAATGAVAGLCPVTEANLGDGIFDAVGWRGARGRFGIGTDSNVLIDAAAELRQLEYSQRLARRARNLLVDADASCGRTLFDAALAGGTQALAAGPAGLCVGASADLVALDGAHAAFVAAVADRLLDAWIFAAARPAVSAVWVRGRQVVAEGRHVAREAIDAAFRRTIQRMMA